MNKKCSKPILHYAIIVILQLSVSMAAYSQNLISADPADTFDPETIFINPGAIPFQHGQAMLGMKVYQLGFLKSQELGLRTSYFSLSLPENFGGLLNLGLTGQNFSVPLYDQTNFSLLIANRLFERLSIGIKYNLFSKSYHQKYFDLVNPDDPVFAKGTLKLAHSIGAGIILFPWSTLSVGLSCDHLNRPDVSLFQDTYRQPLVVDFGLRYSWRYFSSSIYFNQLQQHWQFNWMFESRPSASSTFKFGFVQQSAKLGAQFYLLNGLSINYMFDYPFYEVNQMSNGSHQIGLIYNLEHGDRLKELQFTKYNEGKIPNFSLASQFYVEMSSDKLEIVTQKIERTIADEIPHDALKHLTKLELALDDSSFSPERFNQHGTLKDQNLNRLYASAKYSTTYGEYLKQFTQSSTSGALDLIADPNSKSRAAELRDSLIARSSLLREQIKIRQSENNPVTKRIELHTLPRSSVEEKFILNPESVIFHISSFKMKRYTGVWKLIITDYAGQEIKTFIRKGQAPEEISWDWRDNNGNLIKPDIYYYSFRWEEKNGHSSGSDPQAFAVTKISRTLEIDVRSRPDHQKDQGATVEIKLAN